MGIKLTGHHTNYWKNRRIDWKTSYLDTWNHPHRSFIVEILRYIPFISLWEIGCGPGANLYKIVKELPGKQVGGSDVNADAIKLAQETFNNGLFHVEPGNDLLMSDKSIDVTLTDMTLIYVDPLQIDSYLNEIKRVTTNYAIFCEFHSTNWWKRQKARLGGYHVYNYRKRLEKLGFYDIFITPIPPEYWPGTDKNTEFRTIITARVPKII